MVFLMLCVLEGSVLLPDVDNGGLSCFQIVTFFLSLCTGTIKSVRVTDCACVLGCVCLVCRFECKYAVRSV